MSSLELAQYAQIFECLLGFRVEYIFFKIMPEKKNPILLVVTTAYNEAENLALFYEVLLPGRDGFKKLIMNGSSSKEMANPPWDTTSYLDSIISNTSQLISRANHTANRKRVFPCFIGIPSLSALNKEILFKTYFFFRANIPSSPL